MGFKTNATALACARSKVSLSMRPLAKAGLTRVLKPLIDGQRAKALGRDGRVVEIDASSADRLRRRDRAPIRPRPCRSSAAIGRRLTYQRSTRPHRVTRPAESCEGGVTRRQQGRS